MTSRRGLMLICLLITAAMSHADTDPYQAPRHDMLRVIHSIMEQTAPVAGKSRISDEVLQAMDEVPRHMFVPKELIARAYTNHPLPIGYGQTISQPYIVALMTELAEPGKDKTCLEIGTGSGYQAAVLSRMVKSVYSIEIVPQLGAAAADRIRRLGYSNVSVRVGDGYYGWEENAPFDCVIVTAAADHIPPPLVKQLKPGGVMVIPVGPQFLTQQLTLVTKDVVGKVSTMRALPVRFVPFTRN